MIPTLLIASVVIFHHHRIATGGLFSRAILLNCWQREKVLIPTAFSICAMNMVLTGPIYERYFIWVTGMMQGDFGYSFEHERPVYGSRWQPALPHHDGVLRDHHRYLVDRLSDRHLFRHPSIFLGRLRADVCWGCLGLATPNFLLGTGDDVSPPMFILARQLAI